MAEKEFKEIKEIKKEVNRLLRLGSLGNYKEALKLAEESGLEEEIKEAACYVSWCSLSMVDFWFKGPPRLIELFPFPHLDVTFPTPAVYKTFAKKTENALYYVRESQKTVKKYGIEEIEPEIKPEIRKKAEKISISYLNSENFEQGSKVAMEFGLDRLKRFADDLYSGRDATYMFSDKSKKEIEIFLKQLSPSLIRKVERNIYDPKIMDMVESYRVKRGSKLFKEAYSNTAGWAVPMLHGDVLYAYEDAREIAKEWGLENEERKAANSIYTTLLDRVEHSKDYKDEEPTKLLERAEELNKQYGFNIKGEN